MNNYNPLVSVSVITFNHIEYIDQCLKSIVNQKTNFQFEIIIHDDASTDGTSDVIRKYQESYPELIHATIQVKNQFSQGIRKMTGTFNIPKAKGKYIAMIEGDDFWIDDYKLQKQVDALTANPNASLCFTANNYVFPNELSHKNKVHQFDTGPSKQRVFKVKDVIKLGGNMMHTGSMMYQKKNYPLQSIKWIDEAPVGDLPLSLFLGLKGDIIYLNEITSSYRVFATNSWTSSQRKSLKSQKKVLSGMIKMWNGFNDYTSLKYKKAVNKAIISHQYGFLKAIIKYFLVKMGLKI